MSARGDEIFDQHFPAIGRGNAILKQHFQDLSKGGSGRIHASPVTKILREPPASPLAVAIGTHIKAGGKVDINQWAAAMESAGITGDVIGSAYDAAGGSAVLAPAEAAGDTSRFLVAFVTALESQGAPSAAIKAAYLHVATSP